MPGPYNPQAPPAGPILHHGRRQNPTDYYYYQQQQHYHHQHAPPYPSPQQWYPQTHYPMQPAYARPYHPMPLQPHPQHPMVVSSHSLPQPPIPHQFRAPIASPPTSTTPNLPPQSASLPIRQQIRPSTMNGPSELPSVPAVPTPTSPPLLSSSPAPPSPPPPQEAIVSATPEPDRRMPRYPPLPWYSVPDLPFPPRARRRRRKTRQVSPSQDAIQLPVRGELESPELDQPSELDGASLSLTATSPQSRASTLQGNATTESGSISEQLETGSTQPTTPSSVATVPKEITTPRQSVRPAVVPVVPVAPRSSPPQKVSAVTLPLLSTSPEASTPADSLTSDGGNPTSQGTSEQKADSQPPPVVKAAPKSWADLVRTKPQRSSASPSTNENQSPSASTLSTSKATSLAEVIKAFKVEGDSRFSYLEPRGLVNTGNMCYMNSILQTLLYCIPFYSFLDIVGAKAAHRFKSETPMLDAMILFMKEFSVITTAESAEALRRRLKDTQVELYGEQLIPEYVYEAIKQNPTFSNMRRGHQQDAEEFLGIFLEALHEECVTVLKSLPQPTDGAGLAAQSTEPTASADGGWLEVGPKQRAAITRSSGILVSDSPITKIFGGKLRSELRVPGSKNSVTLEPYRPLQLDIGAPNIHNIVDALKGLTKSETLHGDFNSPRGPGTTATKQVFIETLPPILILHLKRFQYDNTGGVQKIWKKVGYPLELTIPKESFPPQKRGGLAISGLPKYRLTAVVYHHGKNASGGHYTVDVRRQDGTEWIRFDDTVIKRLRAEDVAEAAADEDPRVLAKALEKHNRDASLGGQNPYDSIDNGGETPEDDDKGWNKVNGSSKDSSSSNRKWAAVVNGSSPPATTGKGTPKRESVKDKVAYILFYRKME